MFDLRVVLIGESRVVVRVLACHSLALYIVLLLIFVWHNSMRLLVPTAMYYRTVITTVPSCVPVVPPTHHRLSCVLRWDPEPATLALNEGRCRDASLFGRKQCSDAAMQHQYGM